MSKTKVVALPWRELRGGIAKRIDAGELTLAQAGEVALEHCPPDEFESLVQRAVKRGTVTEAQAAAMRAHYWARRLRQFGGA